MKEPVTWSNQRDSEQECGVQSDFWFYGISHTELESLRFYRKGKWSTEYEQVYMTRVKWYFWYKIQNMGGMKLLIKHNMIRQSKKLKKLKKKLEKLKQKYKKYTK